MEVVLGTAGLDQSYQDPFPPDTRCVHCGGDARVAFVAHELDEPVIRAGGKYVCGLHDNVPPPRGGGFMEELPLNVSYGLWPHDAMAVAVYLCRGCLQATAHFNQA